MNRTRLKRLAKAGVTIRPPDPDTTPRVFVFQDATDVAPSTIILSNGIVVQDTDSLATISIVGGEYQIDGGEWVSASGTVAPLSTVTVRHTSSASFSTDTFTVLTIGGVSATFKSTTTAADTFPNVIVFPSKTGVERNTDTNSDIVAVDGINAPATVTPTGGLVSINAGAWVSSGSITNGQTLQAQLTSSANYLTLASMSVNVGGFVATFDVTTKADPTPTPAPPPNETIKQPKSGPADYTVTTKAQLDAALTDALSKMGVSTTTPKRIEIAGKIADWFPAAKTFPSTLTITAQDPNNPLHTLSRVGIGQLGNVVIDSIQWTYKPAADTFPPVLALNGTSDITLSNINFNLAGFEADGVTPKDRTTGRGIAIQATGGTDQTLFRVSVPSAGGGDNNKMALFQHSSNAATPLTGLRIIESAFQNGKGGDGLRLLGVHAYIARTLIENLTRNSSNDHCDAIQATQDGFNVPNEITCVDNMHAGYAFAHRFEGFQLTNNNVPNGQITIRRLTTVGSEVNGTFLLGAPGFIIEDVKHYNLDYGDQVVGNPYTADPNNPNKPPNTAVKSSSQNGSVIGTNVAASAARIDPGVTFTQNDGFTVDAAYNLGTNIDAGKAISAAWKAANPGVPAVPLV